MWRSGSFDQATARSFYFLSQNSFPERILLFVVDCYVFSDLLIFVSFRDRAPRSSKNRTTSKHCFPITHLGYVSSPSGRTNFCGNAFRCASLCPLLSVIGTVCLLSAPRIRRERRSGVPVSDLVAVTAANCDGVRMPRPGVDGWRLLPVTVFRVHAKRTEAACATDAEGAHPDGAG